MNYLQQLEPLNELNRTLQANVHPLTWLNPIPAYTTDDTRNCSANPPADPAR